MTTGIKLSDSKDFLTTEFKNDRVFLVVNAQHLYRVFTNKAPNNLPNQFYKKPAPSESYLAISNQIENSYGLSLNDIKQQQIQKVFHFEALTETTQVPSIASAAYNKKYNLWTLIIDPKKTIQSQFIYAVSVYIVLFILLQIVVLYFVRIIESNEKKTLDSLTYQATHDPLTGLYNRNYLEQKFAGIVADSTGEISLLFIDLDNFKNLNDTYGHYTGDKLLIQVADRLRAFLPDAEQIIRFGGDEFVIVLQNQVPKDIEIANQLIETISVSYLIDNLNFTIGASIGIAREAAHNCNFDSLLSHADLAMYEAKKRKNSVVVFSEQLKAQSYKTTEMEHHLRMSIENQEIYLNYQPQVNKKGELYGVECLARWNSEVLGFVPPDEFIHSAESIGFMPMLGHHITHTALSEISGLQDKLQQRFHVSINISIKQFMQENFVEEFMDCVIRSGIPNKFITIEVTESLFIEDIEQILSILDQFRRHDISVSLDDFGTGYSSLSLLRQLPIQELKVDKAFVDDILDDKKDAALVRNIINIANEFGMYTLAEGVETAEQLDMLNVYNCNLFQGYYFSKPLNLIDLEGFIYKQHKKTLTNV